MGYAILRWRVGKGEYVEIKEHRAVMMPEDGMHVHHINGVKDDNRPENLEVVTPFEHRQRHAKTDIEFIAQCYEQGMTTTEIGALVDAHPSSISRRMNRHGIPRRHSKRTLSEATCIICGKGFRPKSHLSRLCGDAECLSKHRSNAAKRARGKELT